MVTIVECILCLEINGHTFCSISEQCSQQNVETTLKKYFRDMTIGDDKNAGICLNCWQKVKEFDEFFVHIENVHRSRSLSASSNADDVDLENIVQAEWNKTEYIVTKNSVDRKTRSKAEKTKSKNNVPTITNSFVRSRSQNKATKEPEETLESHHTAAESSAVCANDTDRVSVRRESIEHNAPKTKFPARHVNRQYTADKTPHWCDVCNIWLSNANKFYRHNKQYHLLLEFKCTFSKCVESYATEDELVDHTKCHQKHSCAICGKEVVNLRDHRCHSAKEFVCEICGKKSYSKIGHETHFEAKHMNMVYDCEICGQRFNTKPSIKHHMSEKHVKAPKSVQCNVCGRVFKHNRFLRNHMPVHLDELKRLECSYCGKRYARKQKLKEHETMHTGDLPQQCALCEKRFRTSSGLSFHRRTVHFK